jgi:dinuclear metal center YbgI/SA1388 family protein
MSDSLSASAPLAAVVDFLETTLNHAAVQDWPTALNGLQVENSGRVTRVGAAVDACEAVLKQAAERQIDFLLVHHGLFWSGLQRVQGAAYRKLKLALDGDIAVFSSHLPLDLHATLGNNVLLGEALGLPGSGEPFFFQKGQSIGRRWRVNIECESLRQRLESVLGGPVKHIPGGAEQTAVIGIVTGGAGGDLAQAAAEGVDAFITGEGPHWTYTAAEEQGMNLFYGGHYATETFGVKAAAAFIAERFGIPWEFIDHPTGL